MADKDNDYSSDSSEPPAAKAEPPSTKGILQRLLELIPLGRMPDSKEALEHEIQELLEEGEEQGLISSLEERMITSIFDFRETRAAEIIMQELGLPRRAFGYLHSHGNLDVSHVASFAALVNRFSDEHDKAAVVHCARVMYRLYGDVFRGLPSARVGESRAAA